MVKAIPHDVKEDVKRRVETFNHEVLSSDTCSYRARFRGKYVYLDRCDFGRTGAICRLTYTGNMAAWDFSIFKWSTEQYDPDEWMFPGSEELDGTIEGAMKAGLKAYPV